MPLPKKKTTQKAAHWHSTTYLAENSSNVSSSPDNCLGVELKWLAPPMAAMAGVEVVARTGNRDRAENEVLKKLEGALREARRKRVVEDIGEKGN